MSQKIKPCPKCKSTDLGKHVSALPMNHVFCRKCGFEGPFTMDSFGASEAAWDKLKRTQS